MKLWFILILLVATYSALRFLMIPVSEKHWRSGGMLTKYAKAGTVTALRTLEDFLKIALVIFGSAFILFSFLALVAPALGAHILDVIYGFVARLNEITDPLQSIVGGLMLWVALLAVFWAAWRMRRSGLTDALESERRRQVEAILSGEVAYAELPPTPQMQQVAQNIATCDAVAEELARATDEQSQAKLRELLAMRDAMVSQYALLDVDRRIDLSAVPIDEAPVAGGFWSGLRLGIFSKGTQKGLTGASKLLKRLGTSAACLLVLGVSTPVLASQGAIPVLGSINDIQVFRTQRDAQDSLKRIAKQAAEHPKEQPAEERPGSSAGAYRIAAQQFGRALVASADWRASVTRVHPEVAAQPSVLREADRLVEEVAIRDTLLRDFAQNASQRAAPLRSVSFADESAMPEAARRQYGEFRDFVARRAIEPGADGVVDRIEKWIRAKAESSPAFRQRLEAGLASFRQPASLGDMFGGVLDEALSTSIDAALPDPADRVRIDRMGLGEAKGAVKDAASRMIQSKLADFLNNIEAGRDYTVAIEQVRKGARVPAFFMQSEADLAKTLIRDRDANVNRVARTAVDLHPTLQLGDPPQASERVGRVVDRLRPLVSSGEGMRSAIEGSVGSYDDLFPGRAQAGNDSPLGRALSKVYGTSVPPPPSFTQVASGAADLAGSLGGGGGAPRASMGSMGPASRSFARLRGSVRVGGVLIGAEPSDDGKLDIRDIVWTVDGNTLQIGLQFADRVVQVGRFEGEMVQQALAYAADARPTTVTMTSGPLMPGILRVHIHPSLVNSEMGCELMELDRFVDTATSNWADREMWSTVVGTQLAVYNFASGDDDALKIFDRERSPPFQPAINTAFADRWRETDATLSVFAHDPQRFDMSLVSRMKQCRPKVADGREAYLSCVKAEPADTDRYPPQPYQLWSGVREVDYAMTPATFATPTDPSRNHLVRFMLQIAFEREQPCDDEACATAKTSGPWEFPVLAGELSERTLAFARANPKAARILARADQFTFLQRLFRAALADRLGEGFPRHRLIALMSDAARADPIDPVVTPNWSQSRETARQLLDLLRREGTDGPGGHEQARLEFLENLLRDDSGERFAGGETCRAGALALR